MSKLRARRQWQRPRVRGVAGETADLDWTRREVRFGLRISQQFRDGMQLFYML
jgi:hypothetical protein